MNKKLILMISSILFVFLVAACSNNSTSENSSNDTQTEGSAPDKEQETSSEEKKAEKEKEEVKSESDPNSDGVNKIEVSSVEFGYDPLNLTLKKGQKVELTLTNQGKSFHDWVVKEMPVAMKEQEEGHEDKGTESGHKHGGEFSLHVGADAGESSKLVFTPSEVGEYEIYCSVEGHKEAGMVGKITVEE
ncbi:cupredoxin domain-containing protein [Alkalihalobacillus macyae]|uniref:cupredoxin domain-containing protein n=1 Tax=Guptibacillus hwajinpoensis TaxID=208199 RepID=UPI00273B850C|nr:cupredoxin domain-containing protein [Alkalihalobacillus macyae]MDP4552329.1 cupredoxin domain-containing protein [Alkalihalobacillus macyae]